MKTLKINLFLIILLNGLGINTWAFNACEAHFGLSYFKKIKVSDELKEYIPFIDRIPVVNRRNWEMDLEYNHDLYIEMKQEIKRGAFDFSSFEGRKIPIELLFASFDASFEMGQSKGLSLVEQLRNASRSEREELSRHLQKVYRQDGFSVHKLRRLVESLIVTSNPNYRNNWWVFEKWKSFKNRLKKKIQSQTAEGDILRLSEEYGLLSDESKRPLVERVFNEHRVKINWALAGAVTGVFYYFTGLAIPLWIPNLDLINSSTVGNYVESLPEDELKGLRRKWLADQVIGQAQNILSGFYTLALFYTIYKIGEYEVLDFLFEPLSDSEIVETQNAAVDSESFSLEQAKAARLESMVGSCEMVPQHNGSCPAELVAKYEEYVSGMIAEDFKIQVPQE